MTNKRNNKASGTSAPKRPAQSPPSGNVQGQGSSASAPSPTSQPSTDNSAKRTRVSSEPVMDQDNILTPPAPQDNTSTSSPPPVDTNASPSVPDSGTSLDDSQHSPSNSADKGKSVEILPPEPEHTASPDASTAAIQSSPLRFYAAAAPSTIENFWTHFKTNCEACDTTDREFSSFSFYGSKVTTQGSGDNKLIVIYFRSKPDMEKAIAAPIASLHDLQFHKHDPSAKKADEQLRTLVVTDIPLFVTDAQLRVTFSCYGIVTHCRTRLSKLYRTAYIVFDSATSLDQFDTTWAILCTGHYLRVCPASHSPDQRAIRRAHVALLAGLPRGSVAADLSEIADEVSAKSVNIPFSYNSYNPKPYAYVHFSSAATKESAMGITCALKSIGLTWHEPTDVSSLCHRCGHPGCNPDRCDSSRALQRPSRPWSSNDKLRELYNKHLPPSHPAKRHNRFARPANSEHRSYADVAGRKVPSRSQSRPRSSRSRSRPSNRRHPHRPSQSELDHDIAAMDVPPLMDWQRITEQITIILEEITYLTTEFAQLQNRVKWLEDHYSSPSISRTQQPPAPPIPDIESMNQGWDNIEPSDPRHLSDNLMDFSSSVSPSNDPSFTAHSHIPLPPRMSLIPGPASSPQDRLSSLTATVTELTKTVQQGMAQQKQFLAARDNANSQ
ncbi:hypothetical protein RirG_066420 [Rhizophagus irregularis DAOM 197198w]|uniref:RRM domain-containing protein n=1 Tax=Rhizophagus irregularis (strain DAOM 197198w) TaxID=1432141 RepID=A0A015LJ99_RHIIW|nr:hypothetical protein RirG_066420 [Rhizophagus irregularis DAOM 197198w]